MKTSELQGAALDWAVAKCEGLEVYIDDGMVRLVGQPFDRKYAFWTPSTDWAQGGPIIERESIQLWVGQQWNASMEPNNINPAEFESGPTLLIAALRCYVASKLGDEVEVPDELEGGAK
jgi:hypothetical protein